MFRPATFVLCALLVISNNAVSSTGSNNRGSTIVNGAVYKIQNDSDQMVLTASENGIVSKRVGNVKMDAWTNTDDQKWTIRNSPNSPVPGKQLRTFSSRKNTNNNIGLQLPSGSTTATFRYWEVVPAGNGKWNIKSYPGGLCLQSMGRSRNVEEKPCSNSSRSQKWELMICNSLRCSDQSV